MAQKSNASKYQRAGRPAKSTKDDSGKVRISISLTGKVGKGNLRETITLAAGKVSEVRKDIEAALFGE